MAIGDHLHLVQGVPYAIPHPTMWLIVGPEAFAIGSVLVWGVDALAVQLGVSRERRQVLIVVLALFVVMQVVQLAGHPEDCAALGLLCYALAAHLRGDHDKVGWWLSAAVSMQIWVLLAFPLLLFANPQGRRLAMAVRAALFPCFIFFICLATMPSDTWRQVVSEQPMITGGQRTPWYAVAPRLVAYGRVAGAPSRRWATVLATFVGLVGLRRPSGRTVLIAASAIFLVRPVFETSDWAYFSMPGLVLAVVLAATTNRRSWWALLAAAVIICAPTYGYSYIPLLNPWLFLALLFAVNSAVLAVSVMLSRSPATAEVGPESVSQRSAHPHAIRSWEIQFE